MSQVDKQALREAAEQAMHDDWGFDADIFHEMATPSIVLALLDELKAAENRVAELEAKTVSLPKLPVLGSNADWYQGFAAGASSMRNECADAIRAVGIGVKGE